MYDDLARSQRRSPLELFVVHALIPTVLVSFALHMHRSTTTMGDESPLGCPLLVLPPLDEWRVSIPDVFPVLVRMPKPRYPVGIRSKTVEQVRLSALVRVDGRVQPSSIRILQVTDSRFIDVARDALTAAVFRPAVLKHVFVSGWI